MTSISVIKERVCDDSDLLKQERESYDFRNTFVYRFLDNSYKFKSKYPSPELIYLPAKQFIKIYVEHIEEEISSMDADFWNLIFGYEGSGKSSLSLMLFSELTGRNIQRIISNTIFLQAEYAKMVYYLGKFGIKKEPVLIDDAHYIFGKYLTLTKETLTTLQLARFVRDQQIVHILNTQTPTQLYRDIWFERISNYIYTFKIKHLIKDNMITYRLYACAYLDSGNLKANMESIRNVSNWKFILSHFPPDIITRFDVVFDDYEKEYRTYKELKKFYKQFYAYFRAKGVVKGSDYEKLFKLLYTISTGEKISKDKRLITLGLMDKEGKITDNEIYNLANQHKKVLKARMIMFER